MGEPGHVSERTVWSVARVLWSHYDSEYGGAEPEDFIDEARAALAAAEPLMHEGCQAEVEEALAEADAKAFEVNRLRAQNARLRQAGFAQAAEVARLREALETVLRNHSSPTTEKERAMPEAPMTDPLEELEELAAAAATILTELRALRAVAEAAVRLCFNEITYAGQHSAEVVKAVSLDPRFEWDSDREPTP